MPDTRIAASVSGRCRCKSLELLLFASRYKGLNLILARTQRRRPSIIVIAKPTGIVRSLGKGGLLRSAAAIFRFP